MVYGLPVTAALVEEGGLEACARIRGVVGAINGIIDAGKLIEFAILDENCPAGVAPGKIRFVASAAAIKGGAKQIPQAESAIHNTADVGLSPSLHLVPCAPLPTFQSVVQPHL